MDGAPDILEDRFPRQFPKQKLEGGQAASKYADAALDHGPVEILRYGDYHTVRVRFGNVLEGGVLTNLILIGVKSNRQDFSLHDQAYKGGHDSPANC